MIPPTEQQKQENRQYCEICNPNVEPLQLCDYSEESTGSTAPENIDDGQQQGHEQDTKNVSTDNTILC